MRLAFNATALLSPLTGVGQYCHHLATGIIARGSADVDFFYGAYWSRQLRDAPAGPLAASLPWLRRNVPYSYELRRWLQNSRFRQGSRRQEFDLYHEPNILALDFSGPTVITVHDLSWIRHPAAHPVERVRAMNRYFEPGLRRARALITHSDFVKRELVEVFGVNPDTISTVPLGAEALFHPRTSRQTAEALSRHHLKHGQYFLAVGTLEPRKNIALVLRSYLQLPADARERFPLVIVGMDGWNTETLAGQIAHAARSGQVRRLGYVERAELASLTAGALALVYPSIYEGFGLPPLEAMSCGTPVFCANAASLPEVVGDAGVLIDPQDDQSLMHAMHRLTEDSSWRIRLSQLALERSGLFGWEKCVDGTLQVYRSAVS